MIVKEKAEIAVRGGFSGRRGKFSIDMTNMGHLMKVLTDLYQDPTLAVIREYSTNALDSHRMAGVSKPIEVSLPSGVSPVLTIRDFGLGMSADEIIDVYTQYNNSTKRSTEDANGHLGLGSKAALTYTDQFTVETVKDGRATNVVISRDTDGTADWNIIDEFDTDAGNGVTVKIPSQDHELMRTTAQQFFVVWPSHEVKIIGAKHYNIFEHAKQIGPNMYMMSGTEWTNGVQMGHPQRVVMGNVAYPMRDRGNAYQAIFHTVDMAEVDHTPNREELLDSEATKATLARLTKFNLNEWVANQVNAVEDKDEAYDLYLELMEEYDLSFGMRHHATGSNFNTRERWSGRWYSISNQTYRTGDLWLGQSSISNYVFMDKPDDQKMDAWFKAKIAEEAKQRGVTASGVIFASEIPQDNPFLSRRGIWFDYAKVNAQPVPKPVRAKSNPTGRKATDPPVYPVVSNRYDTYPSSKEVDKTKKIVYAPTITDAKSLPLDTLRKYGAVVYVVLDRRLNRFKKLFPEAQTFKEFSQTVELPEVTDEERFKMKHYGEIKYAKDIVAAGFKSDRTINRMAKLDANLPKHLDDYRIFGRTSGDLRVNKDTKYITDTYPMLEHVGLWMLQYHKDKDYATFAQDVVDYMKMVHTIGKENT